MAQLIEDKYNLGQSSAEQITTPGEEINLDLQLQPNSNTATGATISGVVQNSSSNNAPVEGAFVKLMTKQNVPIMHAVTNSTGDYILNDVPAGSYYLYVAAPNMKLGTGTEITVQEFGFYTKNLTVTQNPNASLGVIAGIVTAQSGDTPINNAMVTLTQT